MIILDILATAFLYLIYASARILKAPFGMSLPGFRYWQASQNGISKDATLLLLIAIGSFVYWLTGFWIMLISVVVILSVAFIYDRFFHKK